LQLINYNNTCCAVLNVAYSKYMYCAVAVNIPQKIKNCAFIYFKHTIYENNTAKKLRKTDYALVPLVKINGPKV